MLHQSTRRLGELDCRIVTASEHGSADEGPSSPDLVLVLCHGFGAPRDDLVPTAGQLFRQFPGLATCVQVVFPAAPLSLDAYGLPGGRAWWMLDMEQLNRAMMTGEFRDLREERPPGLPEAREKLRGVIEELQRETGLPLSRFVLGGFSQGSMLTTDLTLHLDEKPAGLVIWSGTLLNEEEWTARMGAKREGPRAESMTEHPAPSALGPEPSAPTPSPAHPLRGLPIVQSHGTQDMILPFQLALLLRDRLRDAGADVEFIEFNGPHTIPPAGIDALGRLLERVRLSVEG
jgi:phospholipase/carboxylesterase